MFEASKAVTPNIAYFVPRNANVEQVRYHTDVTLYELHKYMSDFFRGSEEITCTSAC